MPERARRRPRLLWLWLRTTYWAVRHWDEILGTTVSTYAGWRSGLSLLVRDIVWLPEADSEIVGGGVHMGKVMTYFI